MDTGNNRKENEALARGDDYLWDGSGEPDPEIQRLEALLGKFRHERPAPVFPEIVPQRRWTFFPQWMRLFPVLAATAAVAVILVAIFLVYGRKPAPTIVAGWDVSRVAGSPRIGPKTIGGKEGMSRLGVGEMLETDSQSRANLQADDTGQIEVLPSTRLRLLTMATGGLKRIALD